MAWHQIPDRQDGYVNMLNKYGTQQDNSTAYQYDSEGIISDMTLTDKYEHNGLFSKIIDAPAEEAIKLGFTLGLKESMSAETFITETLDALDWEEQAAWAIKMSRLYGGALGVMIIDDGGDIDEPLNWRKIKGIDEIRVYERAVVYPDHSSCYRNDPRNPTKNAKSKFGMPERYHITSQYGQYWVHESRCLIFRNGRLPEKTLSPYYRFWGMPEYSRIHQELREASTTHSLAVKLLERSVQAIYSMQGLARLLATEDGEDEVVKRLQTIDMSRHILNSIAIDTDGESYDFKSASMSGVKEVVDSTCNMLSAVTFIPQTILFGRSPAGLNSTGTSDLENYYNYVSRIQKLQLKSNLTLLVDVIIRGGLNTRKLDEEPIIKLEFNPLWSMSEAEQMEIQSNKIRAQQAKAQTAQVYVDMGAIDPSEVRLALAKEEEFYIEDLLDNIVNTEELFGEVADDEAADKGDKKPEPKKPESRTAESGKLNKVYDYLKDYLAKGGNP